MKTGKHMTLNEGDSSYHFLFDENPSLSLIIDYSRGIQDVNKKACEILGHKKIELIGKDPLDLIHPADRIKFTNIIDQLFNKEKVNDVEADVITNSGETKKILFAAGRLVEYNREFAVLISGTDLTETKKTLRDFEENHQLFTKFMNLIPAGIFLRDEENSYVFRNKYIIDNFDPETINMLGTENESPDLSISRFSRLTDKSGNNHYCEITTFRFASSEFTNYTGGIISDLTDRIESERIKRETEILFKKIFENSGLGIVLTNTEGLVIEANPSFAKLSGYRIKELKNKNIRDLVYPDDAMDLPVCCKDSTYQAQKRIVTKKNNILWSNYTSTVVPNEAGSPQYIINMVENITEKKVITEVLETYEHRNKAIISALPDLIFIIDKDGKYLDYSSGSSKDLAIDEKKLIGSNIKDIFSPQKADEILTKINKCIATGRDESAEYSLDIQGEERFFEARLVRYNETSILTVVRNITELRLKELQLKKSSDELGMLNAAKDRLFSIIAHDLRSPFHAMLGLSELLVNDIDTLTNEDIRKIGRELHVAFKNEYSLLENLLTWSFIQKDKIVISEDELDVHKTADEVILLLSWLAEKKDIKIINRIPEGQIIISDSNLLHSIMQNLLSNALKFSSYQSKVYFDFVIKDGKQAVEITDEGIGMSDEEIEILLNKASISKPGTANEQGSGLGLIICMDFVEKLGGKLYMSSKKGVGTTSGFTLTK